MNNPIAANVLGTTGAICWSIQLIPQIITNYRRHHATGLQPSMMVLWAMAGIPLGVYNITQNFNLALQIQPQILTALSLITWAQCMYYGPGAVGVEAAVEGSENENRNRNEKGRRRWSVGKCIIVLVPVVLGLAGVEVGLVYALRRAIEREVLWPAKVMAVLAAVLLCAGVARHYWDIWREKTVRGISFLFVGIDALGDLTSLISVFFQPELDVLGMVIYGSELVLWLGVFACGGWYNFRPWVRQVKSGGGDGHGDGWLRWCLKWSWGRRDHRISRTAEGNAHRGAVCGHGQRPSGNTRGQGTVYGTGVNRDDDGSSVVTGSSTSVFRTASGRVAQPDDRACMMNEDLSRARRLTTV